MKLQRTCTESRKLIQKIIQNAGDTYEITAKKMNIPFGTLTKVLVGKEWFTLHQSICFARLYNVSLDELYFKKPLTNYVCTVMDEALTLWQEKHKIHAGNAFKGVKNSQIEKNKDILKRSSFNGRDTNINKKEAR